MSKYKFTAVFEMDDEWNADEVKDLLIDRLHGDGMIPHTLEVIQDKEEEVKGKI